MISLLLDNGANIEQVCAGHLTPLITACSRGSLESVKILVERGANLNARTPDGFTSLLLAAKNRRSAVVSHLLCQEACAVTDIGPNGYSALHYASLLNDSCTAEMVIGKGADINAQSQDGETPLFLAAKNSCMNCLRVILEAGADPNISVLHDGDFAIHEAVNQGCAGSVRNLLKHGANKTKIGKDGLTPIQRAQARTPSNPTIVESLLNDYSVTTDFTELSMKYFAGQEGWTEEEATIEDRLGEERINKLGREVKECISCPITFEVMRDPVIAADGHTYDREAIEKWLTQKLESPVTRQPLSSFTVIPNLSIKHLIDQYMSISEGH